MPGLELLVGFQLKQKKKSPRVFTFGLCPIHWLIVNGAKQKSCITLMKKIKHYVRTPLQGLRYSSYNTVKQNIRQFITNTCFHLWYNI